MSEPGKPRVMFFFYRSPEYLFISKQHEGIFVLSDAKGKTAESSVSFCIMWRHWGSKQTWRYRTWKHCWWALKRGRRREGSSLWKVPGRGFFSWYENVGLTVESPSCWTSFGVAHSARRKSLWIVRRVSSDIRRSVLCAVLCLRRSHFKAEHLTFSDLWPLTSILWLEVTGFTQVRSQGHISKLFQNKSHLISFSDLNFVCQWRGNEPLHILSEHI